MLASKKLYHFILIFSSICCLISPLYAAPVAGFNPNKSSGCSPLLVTFTNTTTGGNPTTYHWTFGNGNSSTLTSPSASYITPGTYTVTLTATDASGSSSISKQITVFANPTADFTTDKPGGCTNDLVCFKDLSVKGSGAINFWSWDFGDGQSSSLPSPCNRYTFNNAFNVTLVVKDVNGCQSTVVKPNAVTITSPHVVKFTQNPVTSCKPPLTVNFTDSTKPLNPNYTYSWDFGDGNKSSSRNPSNIYTQRGIYDVSLTVTSGTGCVQKLSKAKLISIHNPHADFTSDVQSGCAPLRVNMFNLSTAADSNLISYAWLTSDGQSSAQKNPVFIFPNSGYYTVKLKITLPGNCTDEITKINYIHVLKMPLIAFGVDKFNFCNVPATIHINSYGSNIAKYTWNFGDGTQSNQEDPVKTYNSFGNYTIRLLAESSDGCKDSVKSNTPVRIQKSGFVLFVNGHSGCKPLSVSMQGIDTGLVPITHWQWYINGMLWSGNSNSSSIIFNDTGKYRITLRGWNDDGCGDTLDDFVYVGDTLLKPNISVEDTIACFSDPTIKFHLLDNITGQYQWIFGDGGSSNSKDPTHKYTKLGVFNVRFSRIYNGCYTSVNLLPKIHINGPKVDFGISAGPCANSNVFFSNNSEGDSNHYLWRFGNGDTSIAVDPVYKYKSGGKFHVTLFAIDSSTMCTDSISKDLIRPSAPIVKFQLTDTVGCAPLRINCFDSSIYNPGTIKKWEWSYNSNSISASGKTAAMDITTMGYSSVSLLITDTSNCQYMLTLDSAVHVYSGQAKFGIAPPSGCVPLTIKASDSSVLENKETDHRWVWGNGDTTLTSADSTYYTYFTAPLSQSSGYTILYSITDDKGCKFSSFRVVRPYKPVADFTYTINKKCGVDSVWYSAFQLPANGIGPFFNTWYLGDGVISNLASTFKKYTSGDSTYEIQLIKKDAFGCSDTIIKQVHTDSRKPVAGFYANPLKINCPGPPVFLFDTTIHGAKGIKSREWNFGDGSKSYLENPSKIYLIPGSYDLSLLITDSLNCVATVSKPGYIVIAGPVANYSYNPKKGCTPLEVSFNAYSANTQKFEWDLGDGWIDTNATLQHVYDRPNARGASYKPNLTITDSAGCKRGLTDPDSIVVYPLPAPNFNVDTKTICKGNVIAFSNTTSHDIPLYSYKWTFGDGDQMIDLAPFSMAFIHPYDSLGQMTVSLVATDTLHCSDSLAKTDLINVIYDTIPPETPYLLRATVLNNDMVMAETLQNMEFDFGYYTFQYDYTGGLPTSFSDFEHREDTLFYEINLNTLSHTYSYSIYATDVCKNVSPASVIHTTINLTASGVINAVELNWTPYIGWDSVDTYEVYRFDESDQDYHYIGKVAGAKLTYTDTNITCFKNFYYKVKALHHAPLSQFSWSDSSGAQPLFVSTVPGTRNIRASVENNHSVLLQWRRRFHHIPFSTLIYKAVDDAEPVFFMETGGQDTFLMDADVEVDKHSYTYTTYLKDNCGGLSIASNKAKTIVISANLKENDILMYNPLLVWTPYSEWFSGIDHYTLFFKNDVQHQYDSIASKVPGQLLEEFHRNVTLSQRNYCYKVIAFQNDSLDIFSESNEVCVSTAPRLFAPNVFTINGDHLNDKFELGGVFLDSYHIEIYNRYGERVFVSNDINDSWDGTFKGEGCAADVYVYLAEGTGRSGQKIELKGNVTLIR